MTVTVATLKNAEPGLIKLSNSALPINIAFRVSKVLKSIAKELALFEESRMKLVKKYGVTNEETSEISVSEENMEAFFKEISELLEEEVELSFNKIDINSIPDSVTLSPNEVSALEPFFNLGD
jgi:hypothetical protein